LARGAAGKEKPRKSLADSGAFACFVPVQRAPNSLAKNPGSSIGWMGPCFMYRKLASR
jgi:hypothetical protein